MEVRHIQHLYNRIGFGITPNKLEELTSIPKEKVVQSILLSSKNFTPLTIDTSFLTQLRPSDVKKKSKRKELMKISRKKIRELNAAWIHRLANPSELLREKMTLFWANHFVCESKNILFTQQYNNMLRRYALGDFRAFVKAMSKDPAMLTYLNNKQNKKRKPNENFARELLELFTMGQGNYTETDIQESARAFTGYNHNLKGEFTLRKKHHDYGTKTFFGKTGNFNGDEIIDIILSQKQCATYICSKIYRYFVNPEINKSHIDEMTAVFFSKYDIEELMRFILESNWFYDKKNIGAKIKSPIELIIGIHNTVPFSVVKQKHQLLIQKLLGQTLLKPPNVAGWKGGKTWIDSNTIVTRLRLPSILLNNAEISYSELGGLKDNIKNYSSDRLRKKAFIKSNPNWKIFRDNYGNGTTEAFIKNILSGPINAGTLQLISKNTSLSKQDLCVQLMSLPEYQLC
ncbi:DUF1800 domain-containing protein [Tenacibaculum sp. nBUS_03]|uniref:DUF1800 domain-containing protein n=1 Tax=Tenacibaculum sp. nBUS_03 TaxID=3395320 RepID=UPI003EB97410